MRIDPWLHPDTLGHGGDDQLLTRLFFCTLDVAWRAMDLAAKALNRGGKIKFEMRTEIMKQLHAEVGPGTAFGNNLKSICQESQRKRTERGRQDAKMKKQK